MMSHSQILDSRDEIFPIYNISYSNFIYPVVVIGILFAWLVALSFDKSANIISYLGIALTHIAFLIFIMNTRTYTSTYIRLYIYFAFIMALFGILATLLFSFDVLGSSNHYVNLYEITHGSFTRDKEFGQNSYAFPYGLGMILTASGELSLFGVEFYRISGWAHEPSSATLFVAPAIIFLLHSEFIKNKPIRFFMLITISIFWFLAMSIGSLLAFSILYSMIILGILYKDIFPLKISLVVISSLVAVLFIVPIFSDLLMHSTVLTTKFDLESETMSKAINEFLWFLPDFEKTMSYYIAHTFLWILISCFITVVCMSILYNGSLNVYTIIIFYLVLHSMKGSQGNVFMLIFYLYWLYLACFSIESERFEFKK
jgi:hypothetical protein